MVMFEGGLKRVHGLFSRVFSKMIDAGKVCELVAELLAPGRELIEKLR